VARYSWSDHYAPLRQGLGVVASRLEAEGWRARVLVDDNALVDREAAHRAGLGWYGKNTLLLLPGRGSWFVLGSVVTDAPLPPSTAGATGTCGTCARCLAACPTGALVEPGVLDARRCLAWLLQAPGSFPIELRSALGGRIYGCDDCQEVCPPNRTEDRHRPPPPAREEDEPWVELVWLLGRTDDELLDHLGRWYIPRRQPRYLRRNALVALGNVGDGRDRRVVDALRDGLAHRDPLVRGHAVWAAARLGRADLVAVMAPSEADPEVRAELSAAGLAG
jgi:epoxyqueuosine reductase